MRRFTTVLLALAFALPLAGCARKEATWEFMPERRYEWDDYTARDGTLLASYEYGLPHLTLTSADAAPGEEPPAELAAVRDAFNAEMEAYRAALREEYHEMEQLAIADWPGRDAAAHEGFSPLGNAAELAETHQTARLLSVRVAGYANWGGAYPWGAVRAWNFDLGTGRFVGWADLTDDPDALRAALAAEVVRQAREQGLDAGFYDGWEAEVERFDGCEVFFGADVLTVVFSEQLLGPHAAGLPEFAVSYGLASRYFNDYGRRLLEKEG